MITRPTLEDSDLERIARERFDISQFRDGQTEGVRAVLNAQDLLYVAPTGHGKSLVYQLAGVIRDNTNIVIVPLIALMNSQVAGLRARGINACTVHSGLTDDQRRLALGQIAKDGTGFVYLAPEQLAAEDLMARLATKRGVTLTVDEAHILSSWGHDFRPSCRQVFPATAALEIDTTVALTATATDRVVRDIIDNLNMEDPLVLNCEQNRENLDYQIIKFEGQHKLARRKKLQKVYQLLKAHSPPGKALVYCATRKDAIEIAAHLRKKRLNAKCYHGGMQPEARATVEEEYLNGELEIAVGTSAFGMGIDPDVSLLIHFEMPPSIEAYIQQSGRAGRRGYPAKCILLHSSHDLNRQQHIFNQVPSITQVNMVRQTLLHLAKTADSTSLQQLGAAHLTFPGKVAACVAILQEAGICQLVGNQVSVTPQSSDVHTIEDIIEERNRQQAARLQNIIEYTECEHPSSEKLNELLHKVA